MARTATKELQAKAAPVTPVAEAQRQGLNGLYFDREGKPISRKGSSQSGAGWAPVAPDGWDYLWIRVYTRGNPEYSELHEMMDAGWRPVPHSRHPNLFSATTDEKLGLSGCIMKQGQLLVERPIGMTQDALNEHRRVSTEKLVNQMRSHGLALPEGVRGMDVSRHDVRRGTFANPGASKDGSFNPRDSFEVTSDANYTLAED